ncbi:alpha/beta fold hydrolase [Pseudomonas sp. NPDC089734]|uniref:alpha/beta fold hydrolase n=1 Tax=Pseudomonas sp. NPDC089734 TaxID=3364469 RepID=UPI0037F992FB
MNQSVDSELKYIAATNKTIQIDGVAFAYRELGRKGGVPLVLLNHWGAVLDSYDPRIVDELAKHHHVIATDYRGVGLSGGVAPLTVAEMARDSVALIKALGFDKVDLFGFSLGGFVAQEIAVTQPGLVRKLILTGTGPAGGKNIDQVAVVSMPLMQKAMSEGIDPKTYLFFTSSEASQQAASAFLKALLERQADRDIPSTQEIFGRQLQAIQAWGQQAPQDLSSLNIPVLIANGDQDIMVPSELSFDMAERISGSTLVIYEDAGHGGIFQNHADFASKALAFLAS